MPPPTSRTGSRYLRLPVARQSVQKSSEMGPPAPPGLPAPSTKRMERAWFRAWWPVYVTVVQQAIAQFREEFGGGGIAVVLDEQFGGLEHHVAIGARPSPWLILRDFGGRRKIEGI